MNERSGGWHWLPQRNNLNHRPSIRLHTGEATWHLPATSCLYNLADKMGAGFINLLCWWAVIPAASGAQVKALRSKEHQLLELRMCMVGCLKTVPVSVCILERFIWLDTCIWCKTLCRSHLLSFIEIFEDFACHIPLVYPTTPSVSRTKGLQSNLLISLWCSVCYHQLMGLCCPSSKAFTPYRRLWLCWWGATLNPPTLIFPCMLLRFLPWSQILINNMSLKECLKLTAGSWDSCFQAINTHPKHPFLFANEAGPWTCWRINLIWTQGLDNPGHSKKEQKNREERSHLEHLCRPNYYNKLKILEKIIMPQLYF